MERLMFNAYDFFDPDELKTIAEDEIRKAFRNQLRKESDIERVITNLSSEYIHSLVDEVYGKSFDDLLRQKVREAIENGVSYHVFRRSDVWERSESPAVKILDDECNNSRHLIRAAIEKYIAEYPFDELKYNEIRDTVFNVISEKLFPTRGYNG